MLGVECGVEEGTVVDVAVAESGDSVNVPVGLEIPPLMSLEEVEVADEVVDAAFGASVGGLPSADKMRSPPAPFCAVADARSPGSGVGSSE